MTIDWNKYLKPEVIREFRNKNMLTPREMMIITKAVQEEKSLESAGLPFSITGYDRKFYREEKADYESSKKARGGKPSHIGYVNDF